MTAVVNRRERLGSRVWADEAIQRLEADANRSADTHLHAFPLPVEWGIDLYMKDESVHPTGSLKHRLARSLFLYGLCNGWITERTTIVEASSGSTAVSEAYFARFLGAGRAGQTVRLREPHRRSAISRHRDHARACAPARPAAGTVRAALRAGGHHLPR